MVRFRRDGSCSRTTGHWRRRRRRWRRRAPPRGRRRRRRLPSWPPRSSSRTSRLRRSAPAYASYDHSSKGRSLAAPANESLASDASDRERPRTRQCRRGHGRVGRDGGAVRQTIPVRAHRSRARSSEHDRGRAVITGPITSSPDRARRPWYPAPVRRAGRYPPP